MGIIAMLIGGFVGFLTSIIVVATLGVSFGIAVTVYFATAGFVAISLMSLGARERPIAADDNRFAEWEAELHGFQSEGSFAPLRRSSAASTEDEIRRSA
ncbi:MAG: hypothetical protein ABJ327_15670 [Litoreibacter sp.]